VTNLRRHPRRFVTMAEAFDLTLHIPLREELARIFTAHYHGMATTYGYDAHDSLLKEMEAVAVAAKLEDDEAERSGDPAG
jgi:hypothetical protein